jgi:hypothetical protein
MTLILSCWYSIGTGGNLRANQELSDDLEMARSASILWTGHYRRPRDVHGTYLGTDGTTQAQASEKRIDRRVMMELRKIGIGTGIAVGVAGFVYALAIRPRQLRWGATPDKVRRALPGDDLVPSPKSGYTQAITIRAPKAEVWPWLVQIGYKRAGWYSYDFLHRLVGIAGCVDDERCSAKRVIPELQDLKVGDVIEIAPGMGYTVVGLEPEQALILQSILDTAKWESVSSDEPLPEKYLRSGWVWFLEEIDQNTTRLIARVRNDHDSGLMSRLSTGISNILGRMVMQPKTLRVLKQRAEAATGL